jgi:opacity protein-like surface antigen
MKNTLLVLTLLISTLVLGQTTDSTKLKRIKVGIVYSPDYCYRLLNYYSSNKWVQDLRNDEETGTFGYTTGLGIKIDLTSKIILETGLLYSIKGEQTKNTDLVWATPNPDFPVKSKTQYQFKYIDIPVKINYLWGGKRAKIFVSAGVSANVFSEKKTKVISEFANGHKTSESSVIDLGYLKFNLAGIIGFGIKYDLTKRISISVEPIYRQFINSIVVDKKAKEYPYSFGANVGVYYSFKKKNKTAR